MINNKKGFTLIEAMVALTIFAIVVTGVLWIYTNGYASYAKNNQKIEVQENLRIAMNKMSRNIRQATVCIDVYDGGSRIEFVPAPGNNVSGYKLDSTEKEAEEKISGVYLPIASKIEDLKFQYDGAKKVVTIIIKGKPKNINPPVIIELKTEVQARAL